MRLRSTRSSRTSARSAQSGFTLLELTITLGILLTVMAVLLTQLNIAQRTEHFASDRAEVVDQTRASLSRMTKDVRQASSIDSASDATHLAMTTYVDGVSRDVTYDISGTNLVRTVSGKGTEVLQLHLADTSIFSYEPDATDAQVVNILLQVMPPASPDTTVKLTSEVRLRNIDGG